MQLTQALTRNRAHSNVQQLLQKSQEACLRPRPDQGSEIMQAPLRVLASAVQVPQPLASLPDHTGLQQGADFLARVHQHSWQ